MILHFLVQQSIIFMKFEEITPILIANLVYKYNHLSCNYLLVVFNRLLTIKQ